MGLLPYNASFEELVQDCFLTHRGAGLMLSPLDVQLIMEWAEAEVPFEVVARGIRRAAEKALWDARPGEPVLRTLRACRREVEGEIRKYAARTAGKGKDRESEEPEAEAPKLPLEQERHKRMRSALARLGRENAQVRGAVERLLEGVLKHPPADLAAADHAEEVCCAALVRALSYSDRLALYREARLHAGPPTASAHARKVSRRFHRHALIRRALALPTFW